MEGFLNSSVFGDVIMQLWNLLMPRV